MLTRRQPSDSFSLIHDPRNELGKLYSVDKLGNVWGGRDVLCTFPASSLPSTRR